MKRILTVVSIGPGDARLMNQVTADQLRAADPLILRTDHHPLTQWLKEQHIDYCSLDEAYDAAQDFDDLTERIADLALKKASGGGHPVYAVPDALTDQPLNALLVRCESEGITVEVVPGFSYGDYYLSRCRNRFTAGGFRVISASDLLLSFFDPEENTLITEIDGFILAGEVKMMIAACLDDDAEISLLQDVEAPVTIPVYELDRQDRYDHMTAILIPATDYMHRSRHTMRDLLRIMERLRAPDGCPWDKIQTHESLQPYMVEEAWESIIAMDEKDSDHMADELGDLLFQIVFHASIGKSYDEFTMEDVITHICTKMIQRHPHVFGQEKFSTPDEVSDRWETIKSRETGHKTVRECLDDVSPSLPSLKYAIKVNKKASILPEWHMMPEEVIRRIRNQAALLDRNGKLNTDALGEMLFMSMLLCYRCGEDGEILLHKTVDRFKERFDALEKQINDTGYVPETVSYETE